MPEYQKHLYMICFPINALVASQLDAEKFGEHYTTGSSKHFSGKVIFAEIDINFRLFLRDEKNWKIVKNRDSKRVKSPKKASISRL